MPLALGKRTTQKMRPVSIVRKSGISFYAPRCTGALLLDYPVRPDMEFYDENNSQFKAKFVLDSDFFSKQDFSGTGSWVASSRRYTLKIELGTRELQGFNSMKARLWKGILYIKY
jgi:hypothetical protein